jgi:hypothetical protein
MWYHTTPLGWWIQEDERRAACGTHGDIRNAHKIFDQRTLRTRGIDRIVPLTGLEVDEICALLGYYAALSGSSVPTFRGNILAPVGRDSVVGISTCYGLDGPGIESQ